MSRAPYVLYGVIYIGPVSVALLPVDATLTSGPHLDLGRAPYVLYDVKYIDLVSLNSGCLKLNAALLKTHWVA